MSDLSARTNIPAEPPTLYRAVAGGVRPEELRLEPLRSGGRDGVTAHFLYSTAQTGADGPAAAVVRYAPGASAPPHEHTGYELIQVLDGRLETEHGSYPAGSMLVMTPGSVHAPRSANGCLLLVIWERPVRPV